MSELVTATYENGTLVLDEPLSFSEGTTVEVLVLEQRQSAGQRVGQKLLEIAALPIEGDGEPFSGRDHDRILYGQVDGK